MYETLDPTRYDVKELNGTTVITAKFWDDCEQLLGTFLGEEHYDFVVDEDCDFYSPPQCDVVSASNCDRNCNDCSNEDNVIFKYRRNIFSKEEQLGAYEGLLNAAGESQNRGVAAGPKGASLGKRDWVTEEHFELMEHFMNPSTTLFDDEEDAVERIIAKHKANPVESNRGMVWLRNQITNNGYTYENFFAKKLEEWRNMSREEAAKDARHTYEDYISDTTYANPVFSGIAGYFDRYPRIPYGRATSYTERNYDTYKKCYPFMIQLANQFEQLLPRRFHFQKRCADMIDERFLVAGKQTPFTTITVNKNFRTAAHRDAGDLHEGFSNLTVVAKDKDWQGGYLVLPEFRVAVNIRPGDLLLINNHGGIHGNTELIPPEGKTIEEMERISLVCYFREKMMELGSWEYESLRRSFVDDRRLNKDHPDWRERWNGVSAGMWDSQEWYDYLEAKGGRGMVERYHPVAYEKAGSLEDFFS